MVEVGIAEQNLVGITAGLAACGKKSFGVSPGCFLTARSLEQIKNDICYSDVPAVLVGISSGTSYGALGTTHHSLHDLAVLRAINNITILVPADNFETREAIQVCRQSHETCVRPLWQSGDVSICTRPETKFETGKAITLRDGNDVAFIATGETVIHALLAAGQLAERGLNCRVISMHSIKPLDTEIILKAGRECRAVVTVEEHMVNGGLGEACASMLLQNGANVPFKIVGIPDEETVPGAQADIFRHYEISMEGLSETALKLLTMSLILAIDQSTSATKAVLFDARGKVLDKTSKVHRQIYPQPGWVEHNAEEIWKNVLAVIREIAKRNRKKISKLAGLSIANQRETIVVFDRKTGKPLHNAIVWQCRRGTPICEKLKQNGRGETIRRKTGLMVDTYFSASKLKWLVASKPEIAAKLKNGEAVIGTIDTFLIHRLMHGKVFATDFTNASRTMLFDIGKLRWDETLCKLFDVPLRALPEVRESAAQFGGTNAGGILPKQIPIVGVMGDSQASLFAQKCFSPGTAKATFGTGTSVLLNIGGKFKPSKRGVITALAWVWRGEPAYAFEGIINFSAATIEWVKNQLGLIQNAGEVEKIATSIKENGGVYLVPAFAGLSAPYWSPEARAAIVGMTGFTRKEHIVRAAQEAIAYQIRDVLEMMRADSKINLRSLYADGGPTRNQFIMQFTADITRVELKVSDVPESSAWGAAMQGLLGLGIYKSLDELAKLKGAQKNFRPEMNAKLVQKNYDGWRQAVKRVL